MAGTQWKEYFDFLSSDSKRNIGLCKLCNRSYKDVHGVYSNFLKHLKRVHSNEYNQSLQNAKRQVVEQNRSIVDDRSPTASSVQINKSGRINISFVQQLIVRCNLPLSLIEHSSFRHFLKECYPKWQPMSTKKIKRSIIPSLRSKVYEMIQETLRQVQYVTLTVDAWCDRRGRAFLGLTGHFLNDRFISHAYLIDFLRIKSPHTSDKIQALTELVLDQFNIKSKVFRIITDNAASMIKAYKFGLTVTDDDSTADQVETNSILNQNDDESNGESFTLLLNTSYLPTKRKSSALFSTVFLFAIFMCPSTMRKDVRFSIRSRVVFITDYRGCLAPAKQKSVSESF